MKNKKCILCDNTNLHARNICRDCYNYASRKGKHMLSDEEMYNYIRINKFNKKVPVHKEELPNINLNGNEQIVYDEPTILKHLFNKILDFLLKFR